jgi:hypothetical protein
VSGDLLCVSPAQLRAAVASISSGGVFRYTLRNLAYELVRREAMPAPETVDEGLGALRSAIRLFEKRHEPLEGLIRPERIVRRRLPRRVEPDVYDYSVRRVLAFDRLDTMLLFALNGFYRRIEVGLVVLDGFPSHVWTAIRRQLRAATPTKFLIVHDCDPHGLAATGVASHKLARYPSARVADVGLGFGQAIRLGVPVRTSPVTRTRSRTSSNMDRRTRVLLSEGSYAHLEEMPPLRAMRWVYGRLAKGQTDEGFG